MKNLMREPSVSLPKGLIKQGRTKLRSLRSRLAQIGHGQIRLHPARLTHTFYHCEPDEAEGSSWYRTERRQVLQLIKFIKEEEWQRQHNGPLRQTFTLNLMPVLTAVSWMLTSCWPNHIPHYIALYQITGRFEMCVEESTTPTYNTNSLFPLLMQAVQKFNKHL